MSRKVVGSCTLRSHIVQSGATGKSTQEAPTVEEPTSRPPPGRVKNDTSRHVPSKRRVNRIMFTKNAQMC